MDEVNDYAYNYLCNMGTEEIDEEWRLLSKLISITGKRTGGSRKPTARYGIS